MREIMLDIETIGTTAGSIILTLGAIKFDRAGDIRRGPYPASADEIAARSDSFYARLDMVELKALGFTADKDTIAWWMKQKGEVRYEAMLAQPREPIAAVLDRFYLWFGNSAHPWSHGDDFDCVLIDAAYRKLGRKTPWFFTETRDTRTLFDIAKLSAAEQKSMRSKKHHHALFDCWDQIIMAQESFRRIGAYQSIETGMAGAAA